MTIIKIIPNSNGSHDNQTIDGATLETFPVPEGWAVVPEELETPNFAFGEITVEEGEGVPVVTAWTPLPIPEPEEPEQPEDRYTAEDALRALLG